VQKYSSERPAWVDGRDKCGPTISALSIPFKVPRYYRSLRPIPNTAVVCMIRIGMLSNTHVRDECRHFSWKI